MEMTLKADEEGLAAAVDTLMKGGVVVIPTDTVYGLAAHPDFPDAVERLYTIKARDAKKPIALLASDAEAASRFIGQAASALAAPYWPGALTVVARGEGLRIPDHEWTRKLLAKCGGVLRVTSANLSGQRAATDAPAALAEVGLSADLVIDDGVSPGGVASTVALVNDDGSVKILRDGPVKLLPGEVKAVAFDFGGVMTTSVMPDRVKPLAAEYGIPWSAIEAGFRKYRNLYDGDFLSLSEMYARIWADAGLAPNAQAVDRICEADVSSWLYRNERTLVWMKSLKARGFKIGILTNMPSSFGRDHFRRAFADFVGLADAMVISGEEKLYKPQPEIYRCLQDRIGFAPSELCFIDDLAVNIAGAKSCGWHGIRFGSNDQVERDFARGAW